MNAMKSLWQRTNFGIHACPRQLLKPNSFDKKSCDTLFTIGQRCVSLSFPLQNYYETLGISPTASRKDIREAYIKLSKIYHPDKQSHDLSKSDNKEFLKIKEAFDILSNDTRRYEYDLKTFGRSHDFNRFVSGEYELNRKTTGKSEDLHPNVNPNYDLKFDDTSKEAAEGRTLFWRMFGLLNKLYAFILVIGVLMYYLGRRTRTKNPKDKPD